MLKFSHQPVSDTIPDGKFASMSILITSISHGKEMPTERSSIGNLGDKSNSEHTENIHITGNNFGTNVAATSIRDHS